jgi:hypothetical protein
MVTQNDDLFGAEAFSSDNAAQADRTVAHHGYLFSPIDFRHPRCVMPSPHHVRKREQGRYQVIVGTNRQNKERSVRLGMRKASACAPPASPPVPKKPPWMHEVCNPSSQNMHVPSE